MTFLCEDRDQSIRDLLTKLSEQKTSDSLRTPSTHLKIPDFVKRDSRNYRDPSMSSLFLLDTLNLDQFMLLLSALLLERRVIVTASDVESTK